MARYRGTTAERGLGAPHVADKKRLMALHRDGDPCWRCGKPMYKAQGLERDHMVDRARGGADGPAVLAHMACNRAAGARLGNQLQPRVIMAAGHDVRCGTCGKPYHYAARACEVCGVHYHPSGKTVRTCSRTCGVVLRRRKYGHAGRVTAPRPPRPCAMCGKPCNAGLQFCSKACSGAARSVGNAGRNSAVHYYTCRYCGELRVAKVSGVLREVCPARACQLARLGANNLRLRNGVTREDADAQMAYVVRRASRQW